eukprot:TRINITY_DN10269_c0_g1_i1.p1 TRINITY_DN10269_c0_g1~~TRINITY_DN10269_c0_g1_i1.p1  ORF type:complete len:262 (-),score=71.05 TRINITY_DN10269_c0_g1_i1:99-833(-)
MATPVAHTVQGTMDNTDQNQEAPIQEAQEQAQIPQEKEEVEQVQEDKESPEDEQVPTPVPVKSSITLEQAKATPRRHKARNRRNVWKDQSGSSILELDGSTHVQLVCGEANIPVTALPGTAKFVVNQYQYEKRDRESHKPVEYNEEDDEEYDDEEECYVWKEGSPSQASLGEFLGNEAPDANMWARLAKESLEYLQSSPEDVISALQSCENVRENIMRVIETETVADETMAELFLQLEALNVVL